MIIYAFEETGENRAPRQGEFFVSAYGLAERCNVDFPARTERTILRPIPQAEIEAALEKVKACEEAERVRDWWVGRARCLTEERDSLMRQLEEAIADRREYQRRCVAAERERPHLLDQDDARARFIRETAARLMAAELAGQHLFELDEWPRPFEVAEYVEAARALADALFEEPHQ